MKEKPSARNLGHLGTNSGGRGDRCWGWRRRGGEKDRKRGKKKVARSTRTPIGNHIRTDTKTDTEMQIQQKTRGRQLDIHIQTDRDIDKKGNN